jgi:hypothetical protein
MTSLAKTDAYNTDQNAYVPMDYHHRRCLVCVQSWVANSRLEHGNPQNDRLEHRSKQQKHCWVSQSHDDSRVR